MKDGGEKRKVEIELLDELYKINSVELDKTRDIKSIKICFFIMCNFFPH